MITDSLGRPVVYDYGSAAEFLKDLFEYYKASGRFSLRQRVAKVGGCSQTLVSQVLRGHRQLNRDNFASLALIFKLTPSEIQFIDKKLAARVQKADFKEDIVKTKTVRSPKNHLLSDWLHPYVKDLASIQGFSLDAESLFSMLHGIAPAARIKKSVEFLLREGFWRKTADGKIVTEEAAVQTTNEIPNEKIRAFHKKALAIAARGLEELPMQRRKASTTLISVDREHLPELKNLIDAFQNQLLEFIESHPNGQDGVVQVAVHMTPIGGELK